LLVEEECRRLHGLCSWTTCCFSSHFYYYYLNKRNLSIVCQYILLCACFTKQKANMLHKFVQSPLDTERNIHGGGRGRRLPLRVLSVWSLATGYMSPSSWPRPARPACFADSPTWPCTSGEDAPEHRWVASPWIRFFFQQTIIY
jgi:hypothetical protein